MHLPEFITELPKESVEKPLGGKLTYHQFASGAWSARFHIEGKKYGSVHLCYDCRTVSESNGVIAMANAMEMIAHWVKTNYIPNLTESKCLADYAPGSRQWIGIQAGNGDRPVPIRGRAKKAKKTAAA